MNYNRRRPFFIFSVLAIFTALSGVVFSQTSQPILRLETGMHTANIGGIGVDRAGRVIVTASNDKTARVWDAASGELQRVLRVPISDGDEGKLYAVAVSPDGNTFAVGGWTSKDGYNTNIYLFDRNSGRLTHRISGIPSRTLHLTFSYKGEYLAVTFGARDGSNSGVLIYETGNWRRVGADADYGNQSYGADFDRNGSRLVTSCWDGFIRLYAVEDGGLRLIVKQKSNDGNRPFRVKFSPDGSRIAVGFDDTTTINVLSAVDLNLAFAQDTNGSDDGHLISAAWSNDGSTLYAGGSYQIGYNNPIRIWSNGGRGRAIDVVAAANTILDIQPLPTGGVVYATYDPAWGVIDRNGWRTRLVTSAVVDHRALLQNFRLSSDGTIVQFGYQVFGKEPAWFSIVGKQLEMAAVGGGSLQPPRMTGLNVTGWQDNYGPRLNGVRLGLHQYEKSRSLAIAPDNSRFLLGTAFRIRMFDRTGKELWSQPTPGEAWSVNIASGGRVAVAAYADGTIRWYRVSDGQELLAFFPHNDRKRWVLWTPSGYYDASPDAEELIGWHVNNGKEAAADFFPVSRFRDVYYRPDVIDRVLKDLDETTAVSKANEAANRRPQETNIAKRLPPVVTILSPQNGSEISVNKVKIRYEVRTPSGEPVTGYKVLIDGRPTTIERGVGVKVVGTNSGELTITFPEKDCEISLIAENRYAASVASSVHLKWKGKVTTTVSNKPRLLMLAVGVSKYQIADLNLGYAAKDANDFVNAMSKQKNAMYSEIIVKLLTDEQATRNAVVDGLDWINVNTNAEDVAMIFFAGHGDNDNLNRYYFLPHNFDPQSASTKVTFNDIKSVVETIKGKALFFIDTCRSGNVLGKSLGRNLTGFANELSSAENGVIVFTASTGTQVSLEDAAWGNGAFTKALVEGINGRADLFQKGNITITTLDAYISNRVKELTNQQQTPATAKPDLVSDFSIATKF